MAFVQLPEVRLEYFEHGHGPRTVVFVHGYQASARIWHRVQRALPADAYRSIAVNNRGAGASDAPPEERDFTIQKFASDLHALVQTLGVTRFTLVGHSMGGTTVAQYAVDHPEQVEGLVLLDPASPNGTDLDAAAVEAVLDQRSEARRAQMARGGGGDGIDAQATADGLDAEAAAALRQLMADIAAAPERRLRGSMRSMLTLRLGERVRTLPMPVLLAAGDRDKVIPLDNMLASWAMYPKGTGLHVWHGVGHSPNLDIPDALAALIRTFVEKTVPARAAKAARA